MKNREFADISEFNDYCTDTLDEFLDEIRDDKRFVIFLETEQDFEDYGVDPIDGCSGIWKQKTVRIFENAVRRYGLIAEKLFPDDIDDFEINCSSKLAG